MITLSLLLVSCTDNFLETENPNAPDLEQVLSDPSDWEDVIARQFNVIWHATQSPYTSLDLAGMADVLTASWRNYGMLDVTKEPRMALVNEQGQRYIEHSYYENFKVIGSSNDILRLLRSNPDIEVKDVQGQNIRTKLESCCLFLRGVAYGNIGLQYDQAQLVSESTDLTEVVSEPFEPHVVIIQNAIEDLDLAAKLAQSQPDINIGYYNGINLDQGRFIHLIRTYQAKYLIHSSRNDLENLNNDWTQILKFAREGIQADFFVEGDGIVDWYDPFKFSISTGYDPLPFARIDHRVIAAMAVGVSSRFPEDGTHPLPETDAVDQRLLTDMKYVESQTFPPDRGLYHFSHYAYTRYNDYDFSGVGPMQYILKAENDLMIAEALIRTGGDRTEAANLVNITRVGRGGLPELDSNASDEQFINAIMHERFVELIGTNGAQAFYDRRRLPVDDGSFDPYSGLQPGTPDQFPVPFRELDLLGKEIYTFGG